MNPKTLLALVVFACCVGVSLAGCTKRDKNCGDKEKKQKKQKHLPFSPTRIESTDDCLGACVLKRMPRKDVVALVKRFRDEPNPTAAVGHLGAEMMANPMATMAKMGGDLTDMFLMVGRLCPFLSSMATCVPQCASSLPAESVKTMTSTFMNFDGVCDKRLAGMHKRGKCLAKHGPASQKTCEAKHGKTVGDGLSELLEMFNFEESVTDRAVAETNALKKMGKYCTELFRFHACFTAKVDAVCADQPGAHFAGAIYEMIGALLAPLMADADAVAGVLADIPPECLAPNGSSR